jgi:hypothetical protein
MAPQARREPPGLMAQLDLRALQEQPVRLVQRERSDLKVRPELRVHKARRALELLVPKAQPALQDLKAPLARPVQQAPLEARAQRVLWPIPWEHGSVRPSITVVTRCLRPMDRHISP